MKRAQQLLLILSSAVVFCAVASHVALKCLKIKATWGGYKSYGPTTLKGRAVLHCSSPGYDGIDWNRVAEALGTRIESWATPGSSPLEWEQMQERSTNATECFVAVSPHDLDEYFLCDFHAEIVPFSEAWRDLRQSGMDWQFAKRMLGQYPVMLARKLFPTIGRSDGVLVGLRAQLARLAGRKAEAGEAPKFGGTGPSEVEEKVSDWSEARLQRRLVLMRAGCQGKHSYAGPKKLALVRLLQQAQKQGTVKVLVVPLPPLYRQALLNTEVMQQFEAELADLQRLCPGVQMVRVDRLPVLDSNDYFYDYVHLNRFGQRLATDEALRQLQGQALSLSR